MQIGISEIVTKALLGVSATAVGGFILFPVRTFIKELKDKSQLLTDIHTELKSQRTNCLSTLQQQGVRQIELLEKMSDTLSDIHDGQIEANTLLRSYHGKV
jgi:hypothetical protein